MPNIIKKKGQGGRPQIDIDLKKVEQLSALFCTNEEIALFLDCSTSTIKRAKRSKEYQQALAKGKAVARVNLRRLQWKSATEGNIAMQIFLGKVMLKQSEDGGGDEPVRAITLHVRRAQRKP